MGMWVVLENEMTDPTRVLYVDDDSNSLEVRAAILGEYGFDVVTETNVADAEGRLADGGIDCVLSDLDMPDRDGFDLLESVRETDPDLAFILFTSHESEEIIEQALESGATDYFPKSMTNTSYRLLAHRIEQAIRVSATDRTETAEAEPEAETVGVPRTDIDPGSRKQRPAVEGWMWPPDVDDAGTAERSTATTASANGVDRAGITPDAKTGKAPRAEGRSEPGAGVVAAGPGIEIESTTEPARPDSDEARAEAALETTEATTGQMEEETVGETTSEATDDSADEGTAAGGFVFPSDTEEDGSQADDGGIEREADSAITAVEMSESEWKADVANAGSEPDTETPTAAPIPAVSPAESTPEGSETDGTEIVDRTDADRTETEIAPAAGTNADGDEELAAKLNLVGDEANGEPEDAAKVGMNELETDETETRAAGAKPDAETGAKPEPDVDEAGAETTASTEPDDEFPEDTPMMEDAAEPESDPFTDGHEHSGDDLLGGFEPQPGEGVLVECRSRDDRKGHACLDLLGLGDVEGRNVLLIRYRQIGEDRLRRIAEDAADVQLITIGYRQSIPDDVDERIETTRINNPGELTRLGIVMTRAIGSWDGDDRDTVVCLDSLDVLMGYTDGRNVFRFLHVLLSKLQSSDAIAHFHIDPSTADDQGANTLKPLFDAVVTIDDDGVQVE